MAHTFRSGFTERSVGVMCILSAWVATCGWPSSSFPSRLRTVARQPQRPLPVLHTFCWPVDFRVVLCVARWVDGHLYKYFITFDIISALRKSHKNGTKNSGSPGSPDGIRLTLSSPLPSLSVFVPVSSTHVLLTTG